MPAYGWEIAMIEEQDTLGTDLKVGEPPFGEGVLHNGIDGSAIRRAHMRALTMARQAAERRCALPAPLWVSDRQARLAARRERVEELRVELARIDDAHWRWLDEQGVAMPD